MERDQLHRAARRRIIELYDSESDGDDLSDLSYRDDISMDEDSEGDAEDPSMEDEMRECTICCSSKHIHFFPEETPSKEEQLTITCTASSFASGQL